MKFTLEQRSHLDHLLSGQLGEFSDGEIADEYAAFLRAEMEENRLDGLIEDLARTAVKSAIHARAWSIDDDQQALFDADALLALGDGEHIRMADVRGEHATRHQVVLNENYSRVSTAFFAKNTYLANRIPQLYARDCSLSDLEAAA